MTRVEVAAGAALALVALATGLAVALPRDVPHAERARRDAEVILEAARSWRADNPALCPTLTVLRRDGRLAATVRTDDPWGERFRVSCTADRVEVRSWGADHRAETADDVSVPRT